MLKHSHSKGDKLSHNHRESTCIGSSLRSEANADGRLQTSCMTKETIPSHVMQKESIARPQPNNPKTYGTRTVTNFRSNLTRTVANFRSTLIRTVTNFRSTLIRSRQMVRDKDAKRLQGRRIPDAALRGGILPERDSDRSAQEET